jgi:hypothetical protein
MLRILNDFIISHIVLLSAINESNTETPKWAIWVSSLIVGVAAIIALLKKLFPNIFDKVIEFFKNDNSQKNEETKTKAITNANGGKLCNDCKIENCRVCDGKEVECKFISVLSFKQGNKFMISIPAYEMPLYNEREDLFLSSEAFTMQRLMKRLSVAGYTSVKYPNGMEDEHCHEIHIGSPVANKHTAEYMQGFNNFKYLVPADTLNNRPNFERLDEDDKLNLLNSVEITGLNVSIKGENIKAKRIYADNKSYIGGEFTVNAYGQISSLSSGEAIEVHGIAFIEIMGCASISIKDFEGNLIEEDTVYFFPCAARSVPLGAF